MYHRSNNTDLIFSTGEWTICLQSRCYRRNKAIQDRNVQCLFANNTESDSCDPSEKPITRQECDNQRCMPTWRVVSDWTDVGYHIVYAPH